MIVLYIHQMQMYLVIQNVLQIWFMSYIFVATYVNLLTIIKNHMGYSSSSLLHIDTLQTFLSIWHVEDTLYIIQEISVNKLWLFT